MTVRFVLDTDTVVDVLRRRHGVAARLARESPDDVGLSAMTLAELHFGAHVSHDPEGARLDVERFAEVVRLLPFGEAAARQHADIRAALRRKPIGPNDLVIAATALAFGATLVTNNRREFDRVPGLSVATWRDAAGTRRD